MSMIAESISSLMLQQHLEHLGLDGHVERGGRLVGDEQRRGRRRWPWRSSPAGACRPRTRAGTVDPRGGLRDADQVEHLDGPGPRRLLATCRGGCGPSRAIWRPTVCTGLRAVSGSWKIMAISPPRTSPHALGPTRPAGPRPCHRIRPPLTIGRRRGQQAQDAHGRHRLARARLAHHGEHLAPVDVEADPADGLDDAVLGVEVDAEVPDRQEHLAGARHRQSFTSRASRRPSPTSRNASTVRMMARPGRTAGGARWRSSSARVGDHEARATASGSCTPTPRKHSAASASTARTDARPPPAR